MPSLARLEFDHRVDLNGGVVAFEEEDIAEIKAGPCRREISGDANNFSLRDPNEIKGE